MRRHETNVSLLLVFNVISSVLQDILGQLFQWAIHLENLIIKMLQLVSYNFSQTFLKPGKILGDDLFQGRTEIGIGCAQNICEYNDEYLCEENIHCFSSNILLFHTLISIFSLVFFSKNKCNFLSTLRSKEFLDRFLYLQ